MQNNILKEDLLNIANSDLPIQEFAGKSILVTGATGLIGSLLVKALLVCNAAHNLNLKVFAVVRSDIKAKEIYGELYYDSSLEFIFADLVKDNISLDCKLDYIVHAAAVTNSREMVTHPVLTIDTSIESTKKMLDLAVNYGVNTFIYISSMEMYGQPYDDGMINESMLGKLELWNARSGYPVSKRLCECLCNAYAVEYGLKVKAARLAQTFGPGILKTENRVFAQFAKSVINNTDIVLKTEGKSEGNYVYSRDAVKALLLLLLRGESGPYNVNNENSHMAIRDMAQLVADQVAGNKIKVKFDIDKNNTSGYAADVKMHLSSQKLQALGWTPEVNLKESYVRMIEWMRV